MNRIPLVFLGVFGVLTLSFVGLVLSNQLSYGGLTPYYDAAESRIHPTPTPGVAEQGRWVYQDLGCVQCHTQQVRRVGFGADQARGWGERQSVAREYVRESRVALGSNRIGPDLRNVGARRDDAGWHYLHLYDPQLVTPGSIMPPHSFLFATRRIVGERSAHALDLPPSHAPEPGFEVVPTDRARALVAYLLSLSHTFEYPESSNILPAEGEETTEGGASPEAAAEESN